MAAVGEIIKQYSHAPQAALIHALNPVIRGWATYFGYFNARSQLAKADFLTYQKLRAWAVNRCTGRGARKVAEKYWQIRTEGRWTFAAKDVVLTRHIRHRTAVYTTLKNQKSPYDGDWAYWSQRMGRYPGISLGLPGCSRSKGVSVRSADFTSRSMTWSRLTTSSRCRGAVKRPLTISSCSMATAMISKRQRTGRAQLSLGRVSSLRSRMRKLSRPVLKEFIGAIRCSTLTKLLPAHR